MTKSTNAFRNNLVLLFGSILLSIIILEIALLILLPSPIMLAYPQENYIYDPKIGHWLKPRQKAFTHDITVFTISIGIRDSDYSSIPGADIHRILALGDSQTFGNGLDLKDTWPK